MAVPVEEPVQPGPGKPQVIIAIYGGLHDGNNIGAHIVTRALQTAINKTAAGQKVKIDNNNMGVDPAHRVKKQFGAIVVVNGKGRVFVGEENQTIDFTS
jgi:hypothetical protein